MRVEEVHRLEALAADLGVEVHAAGLEAAVFQDAQHALRGEVDVGGELVGVPAEHEVAGVGVDGAEGAGGAGDFQLVLHGVAGEGGVVGLKVELEVVHEVVFAEEVEARGGVGVVLVLGGLFGLGLDVELALEADLLFVGDGHVEELGEVLELALHVGVPKGRVAFASTPEGVAFAAQLVGDFEGFLHLRGSVGEGVGVAARGGSVRVARMGEELGGAPEELHAGLLLLGLEELGDGVEPLVRLLEGRAVRGDVAVVEGVVRRAELLANLEEDGDAGLGEIEAGEAGFPRADGGAAAEHVRALTTHGVPIDDGEAEVLGHRLALEDGLGVVVFEGERVLGLRTFVGDFGDVGESGHKRGDV